MRKYKKIGIAAGAGVLVVGTLGGFWLARPASKVVRAEAYDVASATAQQLEEVSSLRIFFAHQSVGRNVLDATPDVFAAEGVRSPEIVASEDAAVVSGPMILHTFVGENRDPMGKITEFDRMMRTGLGDTVDVAILKLCYIDVREGDDVDTLFETYRDTLADLERDYPDVAFIYVTVPLTTEFGGPVDQAKRRIKDLLGRENLFVPAHNVARERLNTLIRDEYASSGRLFDIAAIQSTDGEGNRSVRSHGGSEYFATEDFIASDPGHLNPEGGAIVARAFYSSIADAAG